MADAPNQPNQVNPELVAQVNVLSPQQLYEAVLEVTSQLCVQKLQLQSQLSSETDQQRRAEILQQLNETEHQLGLQFTTVSTLGEVFPEVLPENQ